jgi:hypothetical protein
MINIYLRKNIVVGKYTSTIVTMEHLGLFRCIFAYFNHHLPPKKMTPTTDSPKRRHIYCRASKDLVQFPEVEDTAPKGGVVRSLYECKTSFAFVEYMNTI